MYKILLKSANVFKFYQEEKEIADAGVSAKVMVDYETDSLDELAEKYKELTQKYASNILVPMHALNVEVETIITE